MGASRPLISPLSKAEVSWLAGRIRAAGALILRYNGPDSPATLTDLDDALERWSRSTEPDREDPEDVITALGAAFGAHLIDICDLEWRMVSDEFGVDLAVVGQPGDIVIAPLSVTAKRVDEGVTRFFEDFAATARARIAEIRGS